ncbi:Protein phosphatase 2C (PP2C)-like domain [Macleaya cordata]|uniref:protein-serine/threonine phosphatase n=1 Tax=Macleaya cordata TaxID=56857 RepID=A0A200R525_MACCD|nr:Protein phosphatase 2C (PP2C)-like domain [Macleaya cordata]
MAEICCGIVNESKTQKTCEPAPRAARRKRMEIRRFKFIAGMAEPSENGIKRQKRSNIHTEESPRKCVNAVENCAEDGDPQSTDETSNSSSNESSVETVSTLTSPPPAGITVEKQILDCCPKFGLSSVCGRRRDMEDAVSIHPYFCRSESENPARFHFFGVYDGHGCSHVATSCKDRLHQVVKEEIQNCGESLEWEGAMDRSFYRMDKEVLEWSNGLQTATCRCELQTPKCDAVGSTAVVSVLTPDKIVVANCGDSRAVLCRGGKAVPLSVDHKPDRPDELVRIQEAGGRVIYWDGPRVLGVLAMSRAIGDNYLKPYVSSEPEITITDRTAEDECMILASDGLWDVVSNDTACNIVRMCLNGQGPAMPLMSAGNDIKPVIDGGSSDKACSDAALLLTKLALARHSSDNVSVVVVDLRRDT